MDFGAENVTFMKNCVPEICIAPLKYPELVHIFNRVCRLIDRVRVCSLCANPDNPIKRAKHVYNIVTSLLCVLVTGG